MAGKKLTKKENVLQERIRRRKVLLKKSTIVGFKRPEGFGPANTSETKDTAVESAE